MRIKQIFLYFTLILISTSAYSFQYELSLCAIFHNEAPYLKEWVEHHQKQGVQHFWLYNNISTDDFKSVLQPFVKSGIVEIIDWPHAYENIQEWNTIQCAAYMDAIERAKNVSKWCAFLDTDEYLFCPKKKSIAKALKPYEIFGGVVVNWVVYGTSHVERILPKEKMVDKLIYRSQLSHPINTHVKTIAQPQRVIDCLNPHFFIYDPNQLPAVNENFRHVDGPFTANSVNVFRINHYWSRDLDFFLNHKIVRQQQWLNTTQPAFDMERQANDVCDPVLAFRINLR